MTDITNNTVNNNYHNQTLEDNSVTSFDTSLTLKSLTDEEMAKLITSNMTTEEMEQSVNNAIKANQRKNQRKANMFMAKVLREQRLASEQSTSNCDTGQDHE